MIDTRKTKHGKRPVAIALLLIAVFTLALLALISALGATNANGVWAIGVFD